MSQSKAPTLCVGEVKVGKWHRGFWKPRHSYWVSVPWRALKTYASTKRVKGKGHVDNRMEFTVKRDLNAAKGHQWLNKSKPEYWNLLSLFQVRILQFLSLKGSVCKSKHCFTDTRCNSGYTIDILTYELWFDTNSYWKAAFSPVYQHSMFQQHIPRLHARTANSCNVTYVHIMLDIQYITGCFCPTGRCRVWCCAKRVYIILIYQL